MHSFLASQGLTITPELPAAFCRKLTCSWLHGSTWPHSAFPAPQVDLISAGNQQMFRYINYVRGCLAAAAPAVGAAAPELLALARELSAWVLREAHERGLAGASSLAGGIGGTLGGACAQAAAATPAGKGLHTPALRARTPGTAIKRTPCQ